VLTKAHYIPRTPDAVHHRVRALVELRNSARHRGGRDEAHVRGPYQWVGHVSDQDTGSRGERANSRMANVTATTAASIPASRAPTA
jgi:hypothetical protein